MTSMTEHITLTAQIDPHARSLGLVELHRHFADVMLCLSSTPVTRGCLPGPWISYQKLNIFGRRLEGSTHTRKTRSSR